MVLSILIRGRAELRGRLYGDANFKRVACAAVNDATYGGYIGVIATNGQRYKINAGRQQAPAIVGGVKVKPLAVGGECAVFLHIRHIDGHPGV